MTPKQQIAAIKTALSTNLPAVLSDAGLNDFQDYLTKPPNDRDKRQLGVYQVRMMNSRYTRTRVFVIDIHLPGTLDFDSEYDSVIMPVIEQYLTAELIDMIDRDEIEANYFPIEPGSNATDILYLITFTEELDDMD